MAHEASFHLKPATSPAASVAHNTRTWSADHPPPGYLLPPEHRLENVAVIEGDVAAIHAAKMAMASGKARSMKEYSPVWDGVLNLQHAPPLTREQYADQVRVFCESYERITGHRVIAAHVHLDEGRVEHGLVQRNTHAHVTVDRTDDRGRPIRLDRDQLRQVQDLAAQATGLPRGKDARETGLKHLPHQAYRALAKAGRLKTQRDVVREQWAAEEAAKQAETTNSTRLQAAELYGEVRGLLKATQMARQEDYQTLKAKRSNIPWLEKERDRLIEWHAQHASKIAEAEAQVQNLEQMVRKQDLALTRIQQRQDARLAAKARPEAQEPQKPEQPSLSPPSPSQGPRGGGRGF